MMQEMLVGSSSPSVNIVTDYIAGTLSSDTITVGFKPKYIIFWGMYSNSYPVVCLYDEATSTTSYQRWGTWGEDTRPLPSSSGAGIKELTSTGFTLLAYSSFSHVYYLAME